MHTTLHLVRHGEVHNPQRVFYGRLPNFGLSDRGRQQAEGAARFLAEKPLKVIFASPQQRAQETAAILAAQHPGIEVLTDARLDEILVPFDGMPLHKLSSNLYQDAGPDYEQPEAIVTRTQDLIAQVRRECAGHEVAAVTHGDVVAFAITVAKGETPVAGKHGSFTRFGLSESYPSTASVTSLTYAPDDVYPRVQYKRPY